MSSVLADAPASTMSGGTSAAEELALFHRTLAELCRARVPLPRALMMLQHDLSKGPLQREVEMMAAEVEEGVPLVIAYHSRRHLFPDLYRALVEAGIAASDLPGVLDEIAAHASSEAEIRRRVGTSLRYPLYVLVAIVLIGTALVLFLPRIVTTTLQLRGELFNDTATLTTYLDLLPWIGLGVLGLACAAVFLFAVFRRTFDGGGPHGLLFRMPVLGRLRSYAARASFASTLALLARRQLPLPRMLALAAAATDNTTTREHIQQMLERAEGGEGMVGSIRAGNLIAPGLLFLLQTAETCGTAPDALSEVARIYRQRLERATDRLCTLIRPAAEILLGIVVMLFALAYMFPALHFVDSLLGW
ncbi:MAG: type II secretion system F family protein [Planctomycetota bacterium]